jgi:hypothetical protein
MDLGIAYKTALSEETTLWPYSTNSITYSDEKSQSISLF